MTGWLTNSRDVIKRLKQDGWLLERVQGSHHQFRKTGVPLVVTVPHPRKDLPLGLVRAIYRAAGWSRPGAGR